MQSFWLTALAVFFFSSLLSSSAWAQVATPPLDPSQPIIMPAADSWRYIKGDNERDDKQTATFAMTAVSGSGSNANKSQEWTLSGTRGLLLAQTENVNIEASFIPKMTSTQITTTSSGIESQTETSTSGSRVNFAYLAKSFSFGGFYRTNDFTVGKQDPLKETGTGGSVTAQVAKVFFLAFGVEQIKQDETYKSANDWNQTAYAIGLMAGKPDETLLRIEYANLHSPTSVAHLTGQKNIHPEEFRTLLSAEVKMGSILLSYQNEEIKKSEISAESVSGYSTTNSRIGFGYTPANGLILTVYRTNMTQSSSWSSYQDLEGSQVDLNLGFNF